MYYLDEKQFKPAIIFTSIIICPMLIGLIAVLIFSFDIAILIIFVSILLIYIFLITLFKKISKNKQHYMILSDDKLVINYPNINKNKNTLEIFYKDIICFEYYRIYSLLGWVQVLNGVFPKCVFITYENNYEEVCELLGYMNISDIKKIAVFKKNKINC